ncbi:carboxymuconolactone decarboxylase family protein [Chitinophaga rhizophila]|uniref:Carboxymuconolactone decarboxylase family protein n=1 Tax=Chitinophaga rhizophila TaxID=2866212 RepID=A0ABS7G816_9BACT|nr:carboxymuconolactone decarboxylase family protein [Chitinophaga rhizophila]MBW8683808.1 carboxymuconolactone decarboxylase family protein [Chitinophaga rhizophila]
MKQRFDMSKVAPEGYKAMFGLEKYLQGTQIEPLHKELIKIRASQINGCAFCIDMHTKDARKMGETEQRIYALNAWRETPFFSPEERAILALTEEVTLISNHVSDATFNEAISLLGEELTAQVIMAAVVINSWNRIAISSLLMPAVDEA